MTAGTSSANSVTRATAAASDDVISCPRMYASITGFGPDGPSADERAYDGVIQARAGVCATNPEPDTGLPSLLPAYICDKLTAFTTAWISLSMASR